MSSLVLPLTFMALLLQNRCGELGTCRSLRAVGATETPDVYSPKFVLPAVTSACVRVAVPSPFCLTCSERGFIFHFSIK